MYQKSTSRIIKHIDFLIGDLLVLIIAFYVSNIFRHGKAALRMSPEYLLMLGILLLIWTFEAVFMEFYQDILCRGYMVELKEVIVQTTIAMVSVFTFMFLTKTQTVYSRVVFILLWCVGAFCIYLERTVWKYIIRVRLSKSDERTHMLIISSTERLKDCIENFRQEKYQSYILSGAVTYDKSLIGEKINDVLVVSDFENLFTYIKKEVIDAVYLDSLIEIPDYGNMINHFLEMGLVVHLNLELENVELPNKIVQQMGDRYVITTSIKTATSYQIFMKRLMDIVGGAVGLIITGILCVILAPIIYIQSPGPIFFSQIRVGKNGRHFRIYKFRSMYTDAEERKKDLLSKNKMNGYMFKMDDDPRIFPAGKVIRKYSLDEFPQFWNVLKGDMSLVGTRPPTVDEYEQYESHHRIRLAIKPGMTGMWQVSGRSNITDFEEVVQLDNQYINEWNLRLDIKLLLKTIVVVLKSNGSV